MIVYLSMPEKAYEKKELKSIYETLEGAGHATIFPLGGVTDEPLIAVSDAMVMCPSWETDVICRDEKKYAESLGIPIYEYPEYPALHPTESRNPNQAQTFREITGQMYRMHLRKNADYSPANILGTGEIGLVTRMWDKMARLLNLTGFNLEICSSTFGVPKQPKNESIEDTIMDLAVYSIISLIYRRGKWGN